MLSCLCCIFCISAWSDDWSCCSGLFVACTLWPAANCWIVISVVDCSFCRAIKRCRIFGLCFLENKFVNLLCHPSTWLLVRTCIRYTFHTTGGTFKIHWWRKYWDRGIRRASALVSKMWSVCLTYGSEAKASAISCRIECHIRHCREVDCIGEWGQVHRPCAR